MVLTEHFLRRRGYCCGNGCRHCPYVPKGSGQAAKLGPIERQTESPKAKER